MKNLLLLALVLLTGNFSHAFTEVWSGNLSASDIHNNHRNSALFTNEIMDVQLLINTETKKLRLIVMGLNRENRPDQKSTDFSNLQVLRVSECLIVYHVTHHVFGEIIVSDNTGGGTKGCNAEISTVLTYRSFGLGQQPLDQSILIGGALKKHSKL